MRFECTGREQGLHARQSQRSGIVYGLALAGLGTLFLLHRFDVVQLDVWWRWWPLLGVAWGFGRILEWASADDVGSGVTWMLFSGWILVSQFEWFGLDWSRSWPLVLVAFGSGMVATALLRPWFAHRGAPGADNGEHGHA
jgi:hypothetical protein